MRYKIIACFALCFLLLIFIFGCGEDFPILTETLDITNLTVTQSSIGVGETTTIEAVVNYSGDNTVLLYTWTADAGSIQGFDGRATYIAPGDQGIGPAARLSPVHARDRRGGRPDQHVQRLLPAVHAAEQGLPAA